MSPEAERGAFELWVQGTQGWKTCKQRGKPTYLRQCTNGDYRDFRVNDRWRAWLARAALTDATV